MNPRIETQSSTLTKTTFAVARARGFGKDVPARGGSVHTNRAVKPIAASRLIVVFY